MSRVSASVSQFDPSNPTDSAESADPATDSDRLLSQTFLRGFQAGQRLSSREFDALLPSLLEQFVAARVDRDEARPARRWADLFLSFARRRTPSLRDAGGMG